MFKKLLYDRYKNHQKFHQQYSKLIQYIIQHETQHFKDQFPISCLSDMADVTLTDLISVVSQAVTCQI